MPWDSEASEILERTIQTSPVVRKAYLSIRNRTARDRFEVQHFLEETQAKSKTSEVPVSEVVEQSFSRLTHDRAHIDKLNVLLAPPEVEGGRDVPWTLKTNNMSEVTLGGALLLKQHGVKICTGEAVEGYSLQPPNTFDLPVLGENTTVWGNSKATYLKAAAVQLWSTLNNVKRLMDIPAAFLGKKGRWIHHSVIANVVKIPALVRLKERLSTFEESTYFVSDELYPEGLGYLHSGYGFGAEMHECERGLADCSSIDAWWTGYPGRLSTIDLAVFRKYKAKEFVPPKTWLLSVAPKMQTLYEPVIVKEYHKVKPGMIYNHRDFDLQKDPKKVGLGKSGHCSYVLGCKRDGTLVTLAASRDMPDLSQGLGAKGYGVEGWGEQEFPLVTPKENRSVMLFDVNTSSKSWCPQFARSLCKKWHAREEAVETTPKARAKL